MIVNIRKDFVDELTLGLQYGEPSWRAVGLSVGEGTEWGKYWGRGSYYCDLRKEQ